MKNEKIVSAFDSIALSEEASQRMYESIVSSAEHKPKRIASKRFVTVLAAAIVMVLAAGTVFAKVVLPELNKEEVSRVTMDGEIITGTIVYDIDTESDTENNEWLNEHSSYTKLAVESKNKSTGFCGLNTSTDNYNEFESLITENGMLSVPEYIPEGFEFSKAYVRLYITEEDAEGAVQEETFIFDDTLYQCFQFPESIKDNVETITVEYCSDSGEKISFMSTLLAGEFYLSAEKNAEVKVLNIKGFDKAICVSDKLMTSCAAVNYINPVTVLTANSVGYKERAEFHKTDELDLGNVKYYMENYTVKSETVSADELLKILESLA